VDNPGTAFPAAQQRGLRQITFDNSQTGALDSLKHTLQREGALEQAALPGPAQENTHSLTTLTAGLTIHPIGTRFIDARGQALSDGQNT
jgi:hypothetical protein